MRTTLQLPERYESTGELDLSKNRSLKWKLNAAALVLMAALFFIGNQVFSVFSLLFDSDAEPASIPYILAKLGAILLIAAFYLLIHEKIHAMAMERLSAAKASLGFQGTTAYASSRAYFSKRDHRIVLLAPAFFLTLLITLLTLILPVDWFWVGLSALILNLAGSVTDFYAAWRVGREPHNVLVLDSGSSQTYFAPVKTPAATVPVQRKRVVSEAKQKQMERIYGKKRKK